MAFLATMLLAVTMNPNDKMEEIYNFFSNTEYKESARTIVALSVLESGWYRSPVHREFNNYFSYKEFRRAHQHSLCRKRPIYCMRQFKDLNESLEVMLDFFRRNNYPTDRKGFLRRLDGKGGLRFAEDPEHINKIKQLKRQIGI